MRIWNALKKLCSRNDERLPVADVNVDNIPVVLEHENVFSKLQKWNQNFVVDAASSLYYHWIGILGITVLFNIILLPVRAAFFIPQRDHKFMWYFFDYTIDAANVIDLFVGSRTGFLDQGLLVTEHAKLRRYYVSTFAFKMDLFAVLPFEFFTWISKTENSGYVWYRFNRLVKIYKLFEFINRTDTRTNFPNIFRISSLIIFLLIIIHWNGCFFFFVSSSIGIGSNNFIYPPRHNVSDFSEAIPIEKPWDQFSSMYMYAFFWSTLTLTTIAEVPKPVLNFEFIFMTIELLSGVLIFASIVGNVGSMISNVNAAKTDFQMKMDGVKRYMELRSVSKELEKRIINWFDYLWVNKQSLDEDDIMSTLPEQLRAEIAVHVHYEAIKNVKVFQDCEKSLLVQLILKLKLEIYSPGDYICRKGDIGKEMYIVKRGKLDVVADDGIKVFVTLNEGSVFGELSILNIPGSKSGNRRTANVRSVGYSDLFCLNKDDLWDVLTEYPDAKRILIQRGKEILMKDNLIDLDVHNSAEINNNDMENVINRIEKSINKFERDISQLIVALDSANSDMKSKISRIEKHIFFST